jgi:hypothetical protein
MRDGVQAVVLREGCVIADCCFKCCLIETLEEEASPIIKHSASIKGQAELNKLLSNKQLFLEHPQQILPVTAVRQRLCKPFQLGGIDPLLPVGDFFWTGHFQALPAF